MSVHQESMNNASVSWLNLPEHIIYMAPLQPRIQARDHSFSLHLPARAAEISASAASTVRMGTRVRASERRSRTTQHGVATLGVHFSA